MKNAERKARIRAMLHAEGLASGETKSSEKGWSDFRKQIREELHAEKLPQLVIRRDYHSLFRRWQLVPVFALLLLGILFYFRNAGITKNAAPAIAENQNPAKKTIRNMKKGDVFAAEKRRIRFSGGEAKLTEDEGRYLVETSELKADFRLKQKTDLKIEHPLIRVTVTGTEFSVDAKATGGSLNLREGSLRIDLKTETQQSVVLTAPARFEFSGKAHRVKKTETLKDKTLYRYELKSGEVFFAHLLARSDATHTIELLGGKTEVVPVAEILRFAPVAEP